MINGSEFRKADFPIDPLLLDRWSPRAMSGEEISRDANLQCPGNRTLRSAGQKVTELTNPLAIPSLLPNEILLLAGQGAR
jgi:hypothetical protein